MNLNLFVTKPIQNKPNDDTGLRRCLTAFDLTILGIGAVIGAGIFVLTGVAAATKAGPAIILSYLLAGVACGFTALSYAELAASVGGSGSAYSYSYTGFGEIIAWIIGWDLLLEYGVACSTVAIGWSGYVNNLLTAVGLHLPDYLVKGYFAGGIVNLPAMVIILVITGLLLLGVRESTRVNAAIVAVKLVAVATFILVACFNINPANWHPFMPFGVTGIATGAAFVFFAYIGFDAVTTAADETIDPQRNLPIGIIAALAFCTLIYIVVSSLLTGMVPYSTLNVSSPVAQALLSIGHRFAAGVVAMGAVAGLTTVILVMFYGLTRILFAMSRDGLLPPIFSYINPKTQTPSHIIVICGICMAIIAGLIPLSTVAELVNIGTLAAFCLVCGGVIMLRHKHPELPRPFKVFFSPFTPILGIIFCFYLMLNLAWFTWKAFFIWIAVGLLIYFVYSFKHSVLRNQAKSQA